jgi:hypothetical protein
LPSISSIIHHNLILLLQEIIILEFYLKQKLFIFIHKGMVKEIRNRKKAAHKLN